MSTSAVKARENEAAEMQHGEQGRGEHRMHVGKGKMGKHGMGSGTTAGGQKTRALVVETLKHCWYLPKSPS